MDIDHAIEVIEQVRYKPGWKITAKRVWGSDHDVRLVVDYLAPDSSNAPEYRETIAVDAHCVIDVSDIASDLDLLRKVLDSLIEVEIHEAREFFRYGPEAPFHPHSFEGDVGWNLTKQGHRADLVGLSTLLAG